MPASTPQKLKIIGYKNSSFDESEKEREFVAMVNPETYTLDYKVEVQDGQKQGTSSAEQKFTAKKPEDFSFEILLDSTGLIDGRKRESIEEDLATLKDILLKFEGEIHEPKHVMVVWGALCFKGRCTGLNITLKLFNANGKAIRALCKLTFKGSMDDRLREAKEGKKSSDLTHYHVVKDGDTLPLLCFKVYGSSLYYLEVARINHLSNYRNLKTGEQIHFPPLSKNTAQS